MTKEEFINRLKVLDFQQSVLFKEVYIFENSRIKIEIDITSDTICWFNIKNLNEDVSNLTDFVKAINLIKEELKFEIRKKKIDRLIK